MPTYDYKCEACGHEFEHFQSITSAPVKKCPSCNKIKVRRLIGIGAGVIFKGSGFYCTDYRDKTYTAAAQKDKCQDAPKSNETSDSKSAPKSESKPAEKNRKSSGSKN